MDKVNNLLARLDAGFTKPIATPPEFAEAATLIRELIAERDAVLDAPAMVGRGTFGKGVAWATVIGAAQRLYAAENTPDKVLERMDKLAKSNIAIELRDLEIEQLRTQREDLLAALERAETAMEICSDWLAEIEMPDGWTTTTDEKLKISEAIAKGRGATHIEPTDTEGGEL